MKEYMRLSEKLKRTKKFSQSSISKALFYVSTDKRTSLLSMARRESSYRRVGYLKYYPINFGSENCILAAAYIFEELSTRFFYMMNVFD